MIKIKDIGIYIHIPFCKKKCYYCDFVSCADKYKDFNFYKSRLIDEIKNATILKNYKIKSIFLGGGTPTIFPTNYLNEIITTLSIYNINTNAEITIEANPGTLSKPYLQDLKQIGFNRLSIGLQTTDDFLLKTLGRIHTYDEFLINYKNALSVGFNNINIDLMYNIPNQSLVDFKKTLEIITKLKPNHISSYSLIIEPNTKFGKLYEENILNIQSDEVDRQMYGFLNDYLSQFGYNRYEISNFSKRGFECVHNQIYWKREDYLGFGVSAHSFLNNKRFNNTNSLKEYINNKFILDEEILITKDDAIEEYIFLGLRLTKGINIKSFNTEFGIDFFNLYGNKVDYLIKEGFLDYDNDNLKLTIKGIDVSNLVFSKILT